MKKSDLKDGMIVETRRVCIHKYYFVLNNRLVASSDWLSLNDYNEDLTFKEIDKNSDALDIVKVYKPYKLTRLDFIPKSSLELVWNRETHSVLGEILKEENIGKKFRFVIGGIPCKEIYMLTEIREKNNKTIGYISWDKKAVFNVGKISKKDKRYDYEVVFY